MAFTLAQKAKIRRYLGVPDNNRELRWPLENSMDSISAEGQVEIEDYLRQLAKIDEHIENALCNQTVRAADGVQFANGREIAVYEERGSRVVGQLAAYLGVRVHKDPYAGGASGTVGRA